MNIGTLDFEIIGKTDGIKQSLEEAKESIKNFTETAKSDGAGVGDAMQAAATKIEQAWGQLSQVGDSNRQALKSLESEYATVGQQAAAAFSKATAAGDKEYRSLSQRQRELGKEIRQRRNILSEVEKLTAELNSEEQAFNKLASETQKNESRTTSFRMQLRQLTQEMAMQEAQARQTGGETAVYALRATDAFKQMQMQAAALTDAMGDAQRQAQILSHDNAGLQGVISAVSGVAGGFSIAQGAMGLFAGESEDLQKIMVKVQSIMAVTMGLQQVMNTLNKDSAASLTVFNRVRETFVLEMQRGNEKLQQAAAAHATNTATQTANTAATTANTTTEVANTAATSKGAAAKLNEAKAQAANTAATAANTVAKGASTVATTAFQRANIMLAASFRAVGAAIKSIPVIGWILAGVSALVGVIKLLTKHSREAKKEQEEYYKAVSEGAAEPVSKVENLAAKWNGLGNDMKAKQKFVEDNKSAFEELGIKIGSVEEAENALVKNKQAFVAAQVAKAKALAATNKAAELQKERLEKQLEYENIVTKRGADSRKARKAQRKMDDLDKQIADMYGRAIEAENEGGRQLAEAGITSAKTIKDGSVAYYEQAIQAKQAALKELSDPKEYAQATKEIEALQKKLDSITGKKSGAAAAAKDPFKEQLEKRKQQYTEFAKWTNSTDEIVQAAAHKQFENLLAEGSNYLEYLKRQRDTLTKQMGDAGTAVQKKNLQTLNTMIAEETKNTVLEEFDRELQRQLGNADSLIEKLAVVERKRRELANDGTDTDNAKAELLNRQRIELAQEVENEYRQAQQEYYNYLESKLTKFEAYQKKMAELEAQLAKSTNSTEVGAIFKQMETLTQQQATADAKVYDQMKEQYATFEQQKEALAKQYDEKRRIAALNGDAAMLAKIEEEYKKTHQQLATDYLNSDIVDKFLDSADAKSVEQIDALIAKLENKEIELGVDIKDSDLKAIIEKLKKVRTEIESKSPFATWKRSWKDFAEALDKGDISKVADGLSSALGGIGDIFGAVTDSLNELGIASDEAAQDVISDVGGILSGATDVAAGIASGNYLQAITGGIKLVTSAVKLWNDANRENANTIEDAEKKVKQLESAYKDLQNLLSRTYNDSRYNVQKQMIENLQQQIAEEQKKLQAMQKDAKKKSSDYTQDDIDAQADYIKDLQNQVQEGYESLAEDLTQTTIPDIEDEITSALVDAFASGMSDADIDKTIADVANRLMKNAAIEMLKKKYLANAIQDWYKEFEEAMDDGVLTEEERSDLQDHMGDATRAFREQLEALNGMFGDIDSNATTLSGALKGASQESIDLLAGYTNATRIIEQAQLDIMQQHLTHLASIDARFARAIEYLDNIYRRMGMTNISMSNTTTEQAAISQRGYGILNSEL